MNIEQKSIPAASAVTLIATLCMPVLFPHLRLMFFAPFIVMLFYKKRLLVCLWVAFFAGFLIDVLSDHVHVGLYAGNYVLTTWLLYSQRRNFFADSMSTLPIMTFLFSICSTFIEWSFLYAFEKPPLLSWTWGITEFLVMPACDALYSFLIFVVPSMWYEKIPAR